MINILLKIFILPEYSYFSITVLNSRIHPESTVKLFKKLNDKDGSIWSYYKNKFYIDIFLGDNKKYKIYYFGEFIKVPTIYCFDWLPMVIIKNILSHEEAAIIYNKNKKITPQSYAELKECQKQF